MGRGAPAQVTSHSSDYWQFRNKQVTANNQDIYLSSLRVRERVAALPLRLRGMRVLSVDVRYLVRDKRKAKGHAEGQGLVRGGRG